MTPSRLMYFAMSIPLAIAVGLAGIWVTKPPAVVSLTVPPGTSVKVRLDQALASDESRPGDEFEATLTDPVWVNGKVAIPQGAQVKGKVVDARASSGVQGAARLRLTLNSIDTNGGTYELHTTDVAQYGSGNEKQNWELAGGGTDGGALMGALAGGAKSTLIGAPVGAGARGAAPAITSPENVRMPAETQLKFRLIEPLVVAVKG
jgi:hypothetical protein